LAFRTRDAHLALIAHPVGGVGFVLVREDLAVACDRCDGVVAGDEPEPAVVLVPGDRASAAQLGVDPEFVAVVGIRMMVDIDDCIGADVRSSH
jgi:hypothetical protein